MLVVFLPVILLSLKGMILFVLHTHVPYILIYFYIVFLTWGKSLPFLWQQPALLWYLAVCKAFSHMYLRSLKTTLWAEEKPHPRPQEAEDGSEETEETEQGFVSRIWREALFSQAEAHRCPPRCASVHDLNCIQRHYPSSVLLSRLSNVYYAQLRGGICKQKGGLCREAPLPGLRGRGDIRTEKAGSI